jgi:hypothetical protein
MVQIPAGASVPVQPVASNKAALVPVVLKVIAAEAVSPMLVSVNVCVGVAEIETSPKFVLFRFPSGCGDVSCRMAGA